MRTTARPPEPTAGGSARQESADRIRILVVDDHPVVRYGLVGLLGSQTDFLVVGDAGSCAEAVRKVTELRPDVVLLDLELGDACGSDALSRLREKHPAVPTIVFTAYDNDWRVVDAVRIGLQGYLMKGAPTESIFQAVRVVSQGGHYLDPRVTSKVMGQVGRRTERRKVVDRYLTDREKTILNMLAEGRRNRDISLSLSISERTVKYHISGLLIKLRAGNRTEAVKNAVAQGLIRL